MTQFNRLYLERSGPDGQLEGRLKAMESAFHMQFTGTEAIDMQQESNKTRESYGEGHLANGC